MKEARLPDICRIQYGFAFDSAKFSSTVGIPLIRIRDVVRGYSETFTTEEYSEEYIVNSGDILIGMDGEFNIARWNGGRALLNQRVCRLFPKEDVDEGYLFYFMPQALKQIEDKTPFVTVKHLSAKQLNSIIVPLPVFGRQKQIASVLDKLNIVISLRKQQLAKLDELVKARFVEMFGKRNYPEVCIADVVDRNILSAKKKFSSTDIIKYVDISSINNQSNTMTGYTEHIFSDAPSRAQQCIEEGDILISTVRPNLKNIAQNKLNYKNLVASSGFCILRPTLCQAFYLMAIVLSEKFTDDMVKATTGANYPAIKDSDILKYKIPLAPDEQQQQFALFAGKVDRQKLTIQQSLDKLEVLKKSLTQEYFG